MEQNLTPDNKALKRSFAGIIIGLLFLFALLYLPIGMLMVHEVNDNPEFSAGGFKVENGSHAVSIAAALIDREVNHNHWTPSDPFFMPGAWLDRMPAFQKGVISALSRFAIQLKDEIGRARGSSQMDKDLENAAGLLQYPPDIWLFNWQVSWLPTASSKKQYRSAMESLHNYNQRIAAGQAVFERRSDNLLDTLDRFASDMGASSADISNHIEKYSGTFIDTEADEIFYYTKGRMYGYYLLMRELEKDYADIIREKQLQATWAQTLESLREGATISHFFIFNASTNSQFLSNHLANQGFYLVRARGQLREITNILLK